MQTSNLYLSQLEEDYRREADGNGDSLSQNELEALYEGLEDSESLTETDEDDISEYAQRFYEIAECRHESDGARDLAVQGVLNEMERQYFFKKLFKKIKKGGLKGLVGKALKIAGSLQKIPGVGNMVPGLSTITQLARGNLKGALGSLAASGMNMLVPGSGAITGPAFSALGLSEREMDDPQTVSSDLWRRFAAVSRESMENLADQVTDNIDSALESSQAAATAFQGAINKIASRGNGRGISHLANAKHIRLKSGQRIVIEVE